MIKENNIDLNGDMGKSLVDKAEKTKNELLEMKQIVIDLKNEDSKIVTRDI